MIKVDDMKWSDMEGMVTRRLSKLAMCKRGTLKTEINEREEALGKRPHKTEEEIAGDRKAMASDLKKALTPTLKDCIELDYNVLYRKIDDRVKRVQKKYQQEYAPAAEWDKKMASLKEEYKAREAQLDGDFMDVEDSFKLGITPITDFPTEYASLETRSW